MPQKEPLISTGVSVLSEDLSKPILLCLGCQGQGEVSEEVSSFSNSRSMS